MEKEFDRGGEIFSKAIKAGKRTYFFDVKATRKNDFFLTITESKKRIDTDGGITYEKHKIFLYKEDFVKFRKGLDEVFDFIQANFDVDFSEDNPDRSPLGSINDIFDDLDK